LLLLLLLMHGPHLNKWKVLWGSCIW